MTNIRIERLPSQQLEERGVFDWAVWEKGVSQFDWEYTVDEECYLLEGEADIVTPDERVHIQEGDFVRFPKGLVCEWNITKPIKKHYRFE